MHERSEDLECELCGGKDGEHNEVRTMEYVWPGEPHMAPIGTGRCPNDLPDDAEE